MTKNILFTLAIASCILVACQKEAHIAVPSNIQLAGVAPHVCVEVSPASSSSSSSIRSDISSQAASLSSKVWYSGKVIYVKFLNGNATQQSKVTLYANKWLSYANVSFQFVASNEYADVKVAFKWNGDITSWSYYGSDCQLIDQDQPSMNFGWFETNTPDSEYSRTTLHEFGHALALIHEHQSPAAPIQWNKPAVYAFYATQGWAPARVDNNIFNKFSTGETNFTAFDPKSIMLYPIDASFTTNGYSIPPNNVLSATDKAYIEKLYPFASPTSTFYRYNIYGQHFYTSSFSELGTYYLESTMGRVFTSQVPNSYPIYRYFNKKTGDRLSTLDYDELGKGHASWKYEGISGYAFKTKQPNTIPVYRYTRWLGSPDHFFTIDFNELGYGKYFYLYEGIAFYILPG